ncbi:hypothetical protein [Sphingomonas mollis]|uniref:Uncharacterized protein n=1 Tax=Sphingomonas mollis TaxID=2795726 RepID=A0ABS0XQC2_9SPHN|nr:hypothetical protein [Sphingomonas sp. BT553]MBJ6122236.1 hypothetical protein [Sphingomonas sp. BT553]
MSILTAVLLALALLVCNLIYCGRRIMTDLRHSRRVDVTWGSLAFCGAFMAMLSMAWATAASLAHF